MKINLKFELTYKKETVKGSADVEIIIETSLAYQETCHLITKNFNVNSRKKWVSTIINDEDWFNDLIFDYETSVLEGTKFNDKQIYKYDVFEVLSAKRIK